MGEAGITVAAEQESRKHGQYQGRRCTLAAAHAFEQYQQRDDPYAAARRPFSVIKPRAPVGCGLQVGYLQGAAQQIL